MRVVILAGGIGSRLAEETQTRPKPMVEIGGRPMLWHIMKLYAQHGFREFVVALGYRGEVIKQYFLDYPHLNADFTVELQTGTVRVSRQEREDWVVHLVDTGGETLTAGRVKRLGSWLGDGPFMVTYGDGIANLDVGALVAFHRRHGKLATVTAVRPPARFGALTLEGHQVAAFQEKPQIGEGWINAGFFIFEPAVLDYIDGDQTSLEVEPLERLSAESQLVAYTHEGFWQCMDTVRDVHYLNHIWSTGGAPWALPST